MAENWEHDFEPGAGYAGYHTVKCRRCLLVATAGGPHTWCPLPPPPPSDFGCSDATPEDVGAIFDRALSESPFDRLDRLHRRRP